MDFLEFINGKSVGIYLFIFFGKIIEVTIATLRVVLISRGERTKGAMISIFEVSIWIVVTGTVLNGFTQDILKVVIFVIAVAIGTFLGSYVEGKLALGLSTIQAISPNVEVCDEITSVLRSNGLAVTTIDGEGKDAAQRKVMIIHLKRNRIQAAVKMIRNISPECVIAVSDLKIINGGFIKK